LGSDGGKRFPYTAGEFEQLKQQVSKSNRPRKSKQDFLDHLTLLHAQSDTPSKVSENATDKEKEADRIRRLQAPTLDADSFFPPGLATQRESNFFLKTAS